MAKFEQKLQELGLQESELSVACKNLINDYREGINYIETLGENEGGELDVDIEDLQNELEMLDDKIVEKIQWFFDNRELVEKRKENFFNY
jgi:predicted ATP-grasp superfamily ATP-dependent carboligase